MLWRVSMSRARSRFCSCFLLQAVPLLQSGEVAEVADGFGGFRAVAVVDGDGSAQCLDGLGVPVCRRQDAGSPAQVSGQPDIFGPERLFRCRHHLLAVGGRHSRVAFRRGIVGEPA